MGIFLGNGSILGKTMYTNPTNRYLMASGIWGLKGIYNNLLTIELERDSLICNGFVSQYINTKNSNITDAAYLQF